MGKRFKRVIRNFPGPFLSQRRNCRPEQGNFVPSYLSLHNSGELRRRGEELWNLMESCALCPRECRVNRFSGALGFCRASDRLCVASYHAHFGEERPLVGKRGSGTIFFTHCSLRCCFCINWEISQEGEGRECSLEELAHMMLALEAQGCHNINIVTPTHYLPHLLLSLDMAAQKGLRLPLVYNTCGWEKKEILKFLDGVVDIYLPDFKFFSPNWAKVLSSGAESYPEITKQALLEMHRQVGVARPQIDGLVYRGLMIRHLVMPGEVSGTKEVIRWIASNLPKDTYLNLMAQYTPVYKAFGFAEIARPLTREEYRGAIDFALEMGLTNLDIQGKWWL